MAFSRSSYDIKLDGSVLSAMCQASDRTYRPSTLDLNTVLGNNDGKFDWNAKNFLGSASAVQLRGSVLGAMLKTSGGRDSKAAFVNLDNGIANKDGVLTFVGAASVSDTQATPFDLTATPQQGSSGARPADRNESLEEKKRRALDLLQREGLVGIQM